MLCLAPFWDLRERVSHGNLAMNEENCQVDAFFQFELSRFLCGCGDVDVCRFVDRAGAGHTGGDHFPGSVQGVLGSPSGGAVPDNTAYLELYGPEGCLH